MQACICVNQQLLKQIPNCISHVHVQKWQLRNNNIVIIIIRSLMRIIFITDVSIEMGVSFIKYFCKFVCNNVCVFVKVDVIKCVIESVCSIYTRCVSMISNLTLINYMCK